MTTTNKFDGITTITRFLLINNTYYFSNIDPELNGECIISPDITVQVMQGSVLTFKDTVTNNGIFTNNSITNISTTFNNNGVINNNYSKISTDEGYIYINNKITNTGIINNNGNITINKGGELDTTKTIDSTTKQSIGMLYNNQDIDNNGTISISNSTPDNALNNKGTINLKTDSKIIFDSDFINNGKINIYVNYFNIPKESIFINYGTINIRTMLTYNGRLLNNNNITIDINSVLVMKYILVNNIIDKIGGVIDITGNLDLSNIFYFRNSGTINMKLDSAIIFNDIVSNEGTLNIYSSNFNIPGTLTNTGIINISTTILNILPSTLQNNGTLNIKSGTSVQIYTPNPYYNNGNIQIDTKGSLIISDKLINNGKIDVDGTLKVANNVENNKTINLNLNSNILFSNELLNTSNSIITIGTDKCLIGKIFTNNGTFTLTNNIIFNIFNILVNNGIISITNNSTLTIQGTLNNIYKINIDKNGKLIMIKDMNQLITSVFVNRHVINIYNGGSLYLDNNIDTYSSEGSITVSDTNSRLEISKDNFISSGSIFVSNSGILTLNSVIISNNPIDISDNGILELNSNINNNSFLTLHTTAIIKCAYLIKKKVTITNNGTLAMYLPMKNIIVDSELKYYFNIINILSNFGNGKFILCTNSNIPSYIDISPPNSFTTVNCTGIQITPPLKLDIPVKKKTPKMRLRYNNRTGCVVLCY